MSEKTPWKHDRACDYCAKHKLPDCKHYRGGKTASDRKRK